MLSAHPFTYPSHLPTYLPIYPPTPNHSSTHLLIHPPIHAPIRPLNQPGILPLIHSRYLPIHLSMPHLSTYPFTCLCTIRLSTSHTFTSGYSFSCSQPSAHALTHPPTTQPALTCPFAHSTHPLTHPAIHPPTLLPIHTLVHPTTCQPIH